MICSDCHKEVSESQCQPCFIDWCNGTLCQDCAFTHKKLCPDHRGTQDQDDKKGKSVKPTPAQELILGAMAMGRQLHSNRLNHQKFGCGWASISTIQALVKKGFIKAEPEEKFGPGYRTYYTSTYLKV
jgi:hypothetical protein